MDLIDCFRLFTEREQLGKDDLWYCPKCKDHVAAYKKFDLWTCPDVLIIHLKRFQYTPGANFIHRQKIDALVRFPLSDLDLSEVVQAPGDSQSRPLYELYGVSEHMGGMGGGHYTAVVKNMKNSKWYSCDDTRVEEASAQDSITPNAYVLFYRRKTGGAKWAGMQVPEKSTWG